MPINRGMRSRTSGRTATSIVVSPPTLSIVSGTFQLTAVVKDQTGTVMAGTQPDAWHTSNAGVVTVNATGLVTFVAVGTANVTASLTTAGGTITSNTCVVTATTGTNFLRSNFSSGAITPPFYDPFGQGRWDVIDDPTGSGRGKIARVLYSVDGSVQVDDNQALLPSPPPFVINPGQQVWFTGDLCIPAGSNMTSAVQRKLIRWGWDGTQPVPFIATVDLFGTQLTIALRMAGNEDPSEQNSLNFFVAAGDWNTFKIFLQPNSTITATDGILHVWMNGVEIFFRDTMNFTKPADWAGHSLSEYFWNSWGVGDQISTGLAITEYRYWDNISYANAEGAL